MVDYRRMGNIWEHMGNATPTTSWHELDWWKSPRWTVIRIQALAAVAIIISFLLAAFGSCRRWSNRWIIQKGFFAAHALSLSLGVYSIGLMQSSSVKSEMYPIWTVSLFTLFGCIDPVTAYSGFDYKGPLSKVVFGICLNFGYVLLITISTVSGVLGKTAITILSAITFIKGFHRSLALVHQSRRRIYLQQNRDMFHNALREALRFSSSFETTGDIPKEKGKTREGHLPLKDVETAEWLSRALQLHFLGLSYGKPDHLKVLVEGIDYKSALKVIEVELVFLYDVLFSGNEFLYCVQAKAACLWALASFIGICFVGVAAASPGKITSRGFTQVVDTTTADLVITFAILLSLALLQLMQLVQCWTSYWARLSINNDMRMRLHRSRSWRLALFWRKMWMSLRMFVATRMNWFDKQLWQDKIGQYSVLPDMRYGISTTTWKRRGRWAPVKSRMSYSWIFGLIIRRIIRRTYEVLGLNYVWLVLRDLLGGDTHKSSAVRLGGEVKVKESIIEFLGQMRSDRLDGDWWFSFPGSQHPSIERYLPYSSDPHFKSEQHGYRYTSCVMMWHTATWYLEQAFIKKEKKEQAGARGENEEISRNRRVAIALSNYCTYLVASAPDLLPGPALEVYRAYNDFMKSARVALVRSSVQHGLLAAMSNPETLTKLVSDGMENWGSNLSSAEELLWPDDVGKADPLFWDGVGLANHLLRGGGDVDHWKTLALVWVRLLLYAAPYGNKEAHIQRLAQGGEFITHLWALLYHLNIREWKLPETVPNISTVEHAQSILQSHDHQDQDIIFLGEQDQDQDIVVAFLDSLSGNDNDELAIVSKLECAVRFYQTSNPDVAKLFHMDQAAKRPVLVLLQKFRNKFKFTLYDGEFRALAIARFLYPNKFPFTNQPRSTQLPETVPHITTMEHAQSILRNEGQDIVVAFLDSLSGNDNEELANVSKLECGVKFYQTSNPDVAKFLHVDAAVKRPVLLLLRNNGEENILYDGEFRALAIAHFLYANRIPLANQGPAHRARTTEEIEDGTRTEEEIE